MGGAGAYTGGEEGGDQLHGGGSSQQPPSGCKAMACHSPKTQPRGAISLSASTYSSQTSSPRAPRTSSMTCSLKLIWSLESRQNNLLHHSILFFTVEDGQISY